MKTNKRMAQLAAKDENSITKKLQAYELSGASFYEAKTGLIEQGYSEHDITIAVAASPYDGKVRTPTIHPDKELYEKNPQLAKETADVIAEANIHLHNKNSSPVFTPWQRVNSHYMKWSGYELGYDFGKSLVDRKHYTKVVRVVRNVLVVTLILLGALSLLNYVLRLIAAAPS